MADLLEHLFDGSGFPPRWQCGSWSDALGWLHILSDLGIWLAYFAIPVLLLSFVRLRRDIPFRGIFTLFGAFILACGTTHLMEAIIFWHPLYRLAGVIKLFTALVSWATVAALVPIIPRALALRSPEELEREIHARKEAELALQQANEQLERRVEERTRELEMANAALRAERDRFQITLSSIGDAVITTDTHGRVVFVNGVAQALIGWRENEAVGQPLETVFRIVNEHTREPAESPAALALQEGTVVGLANHTVLVAKDGTEHPIDDSAAPIRDGHGQVAGVVLVFRDVTERRRADEALREERARLHATLTGIGDAVVVTDGESRVSLLNPVAQRLTGWKEEATGRSLEEVFRIVNEQTREPAENPVRRVIREGRVVGLANHTILIGKDGKEIPIDDSAAPIKSVEGEIIGVVLVFRDVTERRRAEAEEHRNQEILRFVHQIGKIGHWEWNALTDENKWSPEIEALYGLTPGTFEGTYQAWLKMLHPDDLPRAEADVRKALETGKYFTEFRVIWPDGSIHWLEARATVFKDEHGKPARIMGVNMDVTERKLQEEALRASEERWRTLTEALPNLVWSDLPDGQCDWLSNQWEKYTGIPESELLGLRWVDRVLHPDDRARTLAAWQTACAGKGDYDLEYRIRRFDGEYHWFKTRGVPIRNAQGEITYWFGTCTDIEDVKRLEAALREADQKKDEFLATLAHELRNPLAPIRNALKILSLSEGDQQVFAQTRGMMERQLQQMIRLVDDLMDVSRITRGKIELRKERVELAPVVQGAVETSRPLVEASKHELIVQLPPAPIYVDADVTRLAQVLANLLNNSAKYTERGGRIWLTVARQDNEAVVTVRDSGLGIPPQMLPHIFEMFTQVDRTLEKSQGGLGIGLTLVKRLVELHGGTVLARSEGHGHGSEFIVRLPIVPMMGGEAACPAGNTGATRAAGPKHRILVADDNKDSANSIAMLLRLMGHETQVVNDGLQAVEAAATSRPSVVLLDIGMPKLNGYETARRIRELPGGKEMMLVALTGWGQDEDKRRSQEAGFDHHLVKPADPAVVEKLLGGTRLRPTER